MSHFLIKSQFLLKSQSLIMSQFMLESQFITESQFYIKSKISDKCIKSLNSLKHLNFINLAISDQNNAQIFYIVLLFLFPSLSFFDTWFEMSGLIWVTKLGIVWDLIWWRDLFTVVNIVCWVYHRAQTQTGVIANLWYSANRTLLDSGK